jgi:hypothetical protein
METAESTASSKRLNSSKQPHASDKEDRSFKDDVDVQRTAFTDTDEDSSDRFHIDALPMIENEIEAKNTSDENEPRRN